MSWCTHSLLEVTVRSSSVQINESACEPHRPILLQAKFERFKTSNVIETRSCRGRSV